MSLLTSQLVYVPVSLSPNVTPNVYCYVRPEGQREEVRHKVDYWAVVHGVDPQTGNVTPQIAPVRWTGTNLDICVGARIVQESE